LKKMSLRRQYDDGENDSSDRDQETRSDQLDVTEDGIMEEAGLRMADDAQNESDTEIEAAYNRDKGAHSTRPGSGGSKMSGVSAIYLDTSGLAMATTPMQLSPMQRPGCQTLVSSHVPGFHLLTLGLPLFIILTLFFSSFLYFFSIFFGPPIMDFLLEASIVLSPISLFLPPCI